MGVWCSGITFDLHSKGLGFDPRYIQSNFLTHNNYVYNKLKIIGNKEGLDINQGFINRLKHRIYSWYVDSEFLLLKFMCHRGSFREDIYEKCILCKYANNGFKHNIYNHNKLLF